MQVRNPRRRLPAPEREFPYESQAATFKDDEPIGTVADRLGWLVVSMKHDWESIIAAA